MSETRSVIQSLNPQPEYIHQSSNLSKELALTDLVNTMAREKVEAQQEMEKFKMETRDTIQAMSTQIEHLTQSLVRIVKKHEEAPAQVYVQPVAQDDVVTSSHGMPLPKEVKMLDADETLLKHTDEAEDNGEEGKEDKIDKPARDEEKKITLTKEAEKPKIRIQPPFPRRVARNMEAKETSELLKVLKEENSGMFLIPCAIGDTKIESVVLNMEDSYNIMPLTMYRKLKIEPLKPTRVMIRLADMSRAYPVGIAEGVLVKVKDLILRTDFYILNVGRSQTRLGRPFLEAARDQIDCDAGKPTYPLDGEAVTFDLLEAEEQPPCLEDVDFENCPKQMAENVLPREWIQVEGDWAEHTPMVKSVVKELKVLESKVEIPLNILPQGKIRDPLGQDEPDWTLANNKSISPFGDQHNIKKEVVPARDPQRELKLTKKLLALVIMGLSSACQRKSPAHVVPKKLDTMIVQNKRKELLPMKLQGDWGVPKGHQNFVWDPGQGDPDGRWQ